jgi:hypothetical protein
MRGAGSLIEHSCLLNCTNAQSSQTGCSAATSTSPSSAIRKGRKTAIALTRSAGWESAEKCPTSL